MFYYFYLFIYSFFCFCFFKKAYPWCSCRTSAAANLCHAHAQFVGRLHSRGQRISSAGGFQSGGTASDSKTGEFRINNCLISLFLLTSSVMFAVVGGRNFGEICRCLFAGGQVCSRACCSSETFRHTLFLKLLKTNTVGCNVTRDEVWWNFGCLTVKSDKMA